jgi:hypothetical protein
MPTCYAYLTSATDNRVVRMSYRDGELGAPDVVFAGIPKAPIHNGGRIAFGPDGLLYVTTGDAGQRQRAPDPGYLGGKVLRMTTRGVPAPGNPFTGAVVYTLGHRNPQGLAWGPDGSLYEAEFGQNTLDEINLLQPGNDYGWPTVEGTVGPASPNLTPPLLTWDTDEASPSGSCIRGRLAVVGDPAGPADLSHPAARSRSGREPECAPGRSVRPAAQRKPRARRIPMGDDQQPRWARATGRWRRPHHPRATERLTLLAALSRASPHRLRRRLIQPRARGSSTGCSGEGGGGVGARAGAGGAVAFATGYSWRKSG